MIKLITPKLELENVSKQFDNHQVLYDFNLKVFEGELITIVGTSGCGKTTAIKMVNKLLYPDNGAIYIDDKNINEMDTINLRQSIGYVIQNNGLFPHMTIFNNIAYVLKLKKENREMIKSKVVKLTELMQLDKDILQRYPYQLSGGQQQRVGIARALAASPKILLMDEPFGALDAITRVKLQKELKILQQTLKLTILFVTHDLHEAFLLGDKTLIMNQGKIEQFDESQIIIDDPKTKFVKELLTTFSKE